MKNTSDLDTAWALAFRALASICIFATALVFAFMFKESLPLFFSPDFSSLFSKNWCPVSEIEPRFGILPLAAGSLLVTMIAVVLSVPLSLITAIYMAFFAGRLESRVLKPVIEVLAGIPSVVMGFIALVALVPLIKELLHLDSGMNALSGGLILGLMAAPTIITLSEDALKAVPKEYFYGSIALGSSQLSTVLKVLLPAAANGIVAAVLLGLGRIMGETMAVLMVTGNAPLLTLSPLDPVRTITASIAAEMGEVVFGSSHYHALFLLGLILLLSTFLINLAALKVLGGRLVENRIKA